MAGTRPDQAVAPLERAVAADPDSTPAYARLAESYWANIWSPARRRGENEPKNRWAGRTRNPDLPDIQIIAGLMKANVGWYGRAIADFQRVIDVQPGNGDPTVVWGWPTATPIN